jgi:hypothetical protein
MVNVDVFAVLAGVEGGHFSKTDDPSLLALLREAARQSKTVAAGSGLILRFRVDTGGSSTTCGST